MIAVPYAQDQREVLVFASKIEHTKKSKDLQN